MFHAHPPRPPDWENPHVQRTGTEPPRARFELFPTEGALDRPGPEQAWRRSLNGRWQFHWAKDPRRRPHGFEQATYEAKGRGWSEIDVPGNWQLQGFGTPMYLNRRYPFKQDPPRVTGDPPRDYTSRRQRNPVGSYRRTFQVPAGWAGRRIFVRFGGVDSFFYVWLNGRFLGSAKDSRTPSEWDLTAAVQPGDNLLAVEVFQYSDGSYLECQDKWRLSGIFRDVELSCAPPVYLRDFEVRAGLDAGWRDGTLHAEATVRNTGGNAATVELRFALLGPRRWDRDEPPPPGVPVRDGTATATIEPGGEATLTWDTAVPKVAPWSAEAPHLYTLRVRAGEGTPEQHAQFDVGFRTVAIVDRQLCVNGRAVTIHGVNRNEWSADGGFRLSLEEMERDAALLKRSNVNAVRTSHYPNDGRWYELCDRHGLYVVAEANLEAHPMGAYEEHALLRDPAWAEAVLGRERRNVELLKNHASVILWSLGNEAGNGPHLHAAYAWVKARDPSRPVQFESALRAANTDVYCPMYARPDDLEVYATDPGADRPLILCEYAHAMGNALGGFQKYWDVIERHPILQGGFIWEWCDLALRAPGTFPGTPQYRYGGDFGEIPNDGNFCCDGLVNPDRLPHPMLEEVKKVYAPLLGEGLPGGAARVTNRQAFASLDAWECRWEVAVEGRPVAAGVWEEVPRPLPGEAAEAKLPAGAMAAAGTGERILTLSWRLREAMRWAPAGHEVAWTQLALPGTADDQPPAGRAVVAGTPSIPILEVTSETYRLRDGELFAEVHRQSGTLQTLRYGGRDCLWGPLRSNLWRPPNDSLARMPYDAAYGLWTEARSPTYPLGTEAEVRNGAVWIVTHLRLGSHAVWETEYCFPGGGVVEVRVRFAPLRAALPPVPRLGLRARLPGALRRVRWYGRGPHETQADRQESGRLGVFEASVESLHVPYLFPQINGNRTGVRWVELSDSDGYGLRIRSLNEPFQFTAHDYGDAELAAARHEEELVRGAFVDLQIDARQMGVGGDNAWGADVHPEYQIPAVEHRFGFEISPLAE